MTDLGPYLVRLCIGAFALLVCWTVTCVSFAFFGWLAKRTGMVKARRPLYLGRARRYLK